MVRGYADAVADAFAPGAEPAGFVRVLNSRHFLVRGKIHHGESVRPVQLCEDPVARAVGVAFNDYGEYSLVIVDFPGDFHLLKIEDGYKLPWRRSGGRKFSIVRQGHVVQTSSHRNALDLLQRFG